MNDPMKELWKKINEVHCLYIESDETPEKIDYETELAALIHDFLSIVPHNCKFHFTDTHHVLRRSILSNPDVNYLKLAKAWLSMSKYASNLISQPWRKEYTIIKLYSGFYKHQIEPVLLGGEVILELMGYRQTQPGHMELVEPIDGDTVRVVALDTLIAMVECKIFRMIYEDVAKHLPSISWKDIIEAREVYAGSPEFIRNKLLTKFSYPSTRQHCRSNSYGTACNAAYPTPVQCNGYASSMPLHTATYLPPSTMNGYYCQHYGGHNVPVNYPCNVPSGKLIDLDPPPYRTPDSYTRSPLTSSDEVNLLPGPSGVNNKPRDESWGYVLDTLDKPSTSSNNSKKYSTASNGGDRYSGVAADRYNMNTISAGGSGESITRCLEGMKSLRLDENQPRGGTSTGQAASRGSTGASAGQAALSVDEIDVGGGEGRKYRVKEERYGEDRDKYRGKDDRYIEDREKYRTKDERYIEDRERYRGKDERYVERDYGRESKTYRRDSEREREREKELERERERERDRERDFKKKEKEMIERMREVRNSISPDAQYDDESRPRIEDNTHQYAPLRVNLTPEPNVNSGLRVNLTTDTSVSSGLRVNLTPETSNLPSEGSTRTWSCEFCTYMNKSKKEICEMCGKSRNSAVEIKPLESGGRQCPKCTLVNDKEATKCEACDASLEHSATYI
uniref:Protein tamozhennic n=1 Tax=Cacopsylla melanoneura TaxID=428564 RepID=A0A8D8RV03_9HEMI